MLKIAIVLFAVAALGGVVLATLHLKTKGAPVALAILHGLLAVTGLVTLILAVLNMATVGWAGVALGIFILAALGGFVLFGLDLKKRALPRGLIAVHGLAAVVAFLILLSVVLRG